MNLHKLKLYRLETICYDCPHYEELTYTKYIKYCTKCTLTKPNYLTNESKRNKV